jgi:hypothetical protein
MGFLPVTAARVFFSFLFCGLRQIVGLQSMYAIIVRPSFPAVAGAGDLLFRRAHIEQMKNAFVCFPPRQSISCMMMIREGGRGQLQLSLSLRPPPITELSRPTKSNLSPC